MWDEVVLHLPWRLGACLDTINGLTCWTLQTPILREKVALQSNEETASVMTFPSAP